MSLKSDIAALQHGIDHTDPASTWFPADTATVRRLLAELAAKAVAAPDAAQEDKLTALVKSLRQELNSVRTQLNLVAAERDSLRIAARDFHREKDTAKP